MDGKKFKLGLKSVIAIVLVLVVLFGTVSGAIILSIQKNPSVKDLTEPGAGSGEGGSDPYKGAVAEISNNVKVLTAEEAKKINESILTVNSTNQGVYIEIADGTAMESLGIGDIFFLNGSTETPLGEPYFGKIVSKVDRGGSDMYCVEAPMIDEVFDKFDIEHTEELTAENVSSIITIEGVTVSADKSLKNHFSNERIKNLAAYKETTQAVMLDNGIDQSKEDAFVFECKIDILKAFGLKGKDDDDKDKEKYTLQEAERITVYITESGTRYHRENCQYVKNNPIKSTLAQAVNDKNLQACKKCTPPVIEKDDGVLDGDASVVLEGKIGVEALEYSVDYDWDIENAKGLQDLSVTVNGTFVSELALKAYAELELGGRTTTITLPGNCVKLEGLKEKMFPFAFIGYNGSVSVAMGNEAIRAQTSAVPITIAFIFYADISGKIEVGAELFFNYSRDLKYTATIVKDGQWVWDNELIKEDPETEYGFKIEISGDIDFHIGTSIALYIFNLNVIDCALVKIGAEAQGSANFAITNKTVLNDDKKFDLDYDIYMRTYLKLFEFRVNISFNFDIWIFEGGFNYRKTFTAYDHTIFQIGKVNPTRYESATMTYTNVTASDKDAIYYKDTTGKLVREIDGKKTTLYSDEFFSICGIDETFIYITVRNDSGDLDVYRISKESSGDQRRILDNIKICFTSDENYIYYLTSFDQTIIHKLNRSDLTVSEFMDFDEAVNCMRPVGDNFYITVGDPDVLSFLFGITMDNYLVNKNGAIIGDYGTSPEPGEVYREDKGTYYFAAEVQTSGHLRTTAKEVYWLSKDRSSSIKLSCLVGYSGREAGIFTVHTNSSGSENPYQMVVYRASDGELVKVTGVDNQYSSFTLCQTDGGDWYFFDQNSEGLTLYSMNENYQNKTAIKTFTFEEFPCTLENCSMVLFENRLYFYTMDENNLTSAVLYRYDIA
ncbi:MAG: hypothetical protein E7633_04410 [Ruminococcaceae bacterium]|nr:hypothetical protein [Oscillospiraceae bacterium]